MNFEFLPDSVFVKVLQFLDPVTRCKARRVAKGWNETILYNKQWPTEKNFGLTLSVFHLKVMIKNMKTNLVHSSLQDFIKLENFERTVAILKPETMCLEGKF